MIVIKIYKFPIYLSNLTIYILIFRLFESNKRLNDSTVKANIFCGKSYDLREGLLRG